MDRDDWRTQLPPSSRSMIVNKIVDTLKKYLPFSGPDGINELLRIANRFENRIFNNAINQNDYLRRISLKMLTLETNSQNRADLPSLLQATDNSSLPLVLDHTVNNDNLEASLLDKEPAVNTDDWRTQQPPDSRQKNISELMETLKKHVPYSGEEGINELMRIAVSFEELVFNTALNQEDYFRKISSKMLTMEQSNPYL